MLVCRYHCIRCSFRPTRIKASDTKVWGCRWHLFLLEPCCGPPACETGVKFQSKQMIMYFRLDAVRQTTSTTNEKVLLRNKFNFIFLGESFCHAHNEKEQVNFWRNLNFHLIFFFVDSTNEIFEHLRVSFILTGAYKAAGYVAKLSHSLIGRGICQCYFIAFRALCPIFLMC